MRTLICENNWNSAGRKRGRPTNPQRKIDRPRLCSGAARNRRKQRRRNRQDGPTSSNPATRSLPSRGGFIILRRAGRRLSTRTRKALMIRRSYELGRALSFREVEPLVIEESGGQDRRYRKR